MYGRMGVADGRFRRDFIYVMHRAHLPRITKDRLQSVPLQGGLYSQVSEGALSAASASGALLSVFSAGEVATGEVSVLSAVVFLRLRRRRGRFLTGASFSLSR